MMKSRVWIYDRQNSLLSGEPLDMEVALLKQYAEDKGYNIVGITTEISEGRESARKGLKEVWENAKANNFDVLLVKDIAKIGLDVISVESFISSMENAFGVKIECAKEKLEHQEDSRQDILLVGHSDKGNLRLHNYEEVAKFICTHGKYGDLTITTEDGRWFMDTYGIYINRIADMDYRDRLLTYLIPLQMEADYEDMIDDEIEM